MIDITKFLIVSIQNFDKLILDLNLDLTISNSEYLITYLFTNFLAYYLIFLSIKTIMTCYYMIFSKKGGMI